MHSKRTGHVCDDVPRPGSATTPLVLCSRTTARATANVGPEMAGLFSTQSVHRHRVGSRKDLNSINEQAHSVESTASNIGDLFHETGNYCRKQQSKAIGPSPRPWRSPKGDSSRTRLSKADTARSFPRLPACYGFSIIAKIIPGARAGLLRIRQEHRESRG